MEILATASPDADSSASRVCKKMHVLVHAAGLPGESSFIVSFVVDHGVLLISISDGAVRRVLAEKIRKDLKIQYGPEYDIYLGRLIVLHKRILEEVPYENAPKKIIQAIGKYDATKLLKQGRMHESEFWMVEIAGLKHRS